MHCPGSVNFLHEHPLPRSGKASDGTITHELSEAILNYRLESDKVGDAYEQLLLEQHDEARQERALLYVNHVWNTYKRLEAQGKEPLLFVELTGNLPQLHESAFSTLDAGIVCKNGPFYIIDLKDGEWDVQADDNKQLMYYMAVLLNHAAIDYTPTSLNMHIVQPKNGGVKKWSCSRRKIDGLIEQLHEAAKLVYAENPKRIPGAHCSLFCNRVQCPEYRAHHQKSTKIEFDPIEPLDTDSAPDVETLSVEQLCNVIQQAEFLSELASDAQKILKHKGMHGEDMGSYKLIRGSGRYKLTASVKDLAGALNLKESEFYEQPAVKSKSALEKLIKAKYSDTKTKKNKLSILLQNCTRPEGEIKFVHKDAAGEPYTPDTTTQFDTIED
jgi:hypothetical protein